MNGIIGGKNIYKYIYKYMIAWEWVNLHLNGGVGVEKTKSNGATNQLI